MKRIILLFTICCSVLSARAQFGGGGSTITGKISGTVVDSLTKKPLDYATVSIFRSKGKAPINGVLTDEKGNFKLNNVAPGKYKITVSYIGYPAKSFDPVETTLSKPDNNMGIVIIAPSSKVLSQVNVVGQQAVIETKIDKIVYNAEKDLSATGGNATDVLRKVPLVAVDINGNVSLRGDQNVKVLINGKPSGAMSNNLADVLRSFPSDQIKSIEVITSPSAKYDAEGSGGIINIITKSKNISGVSGGISGGVGTRQNNGNANLNIKQNRLSITGNFGGNFTWPQVTPTTFHSYNDSLLLTNDQTSSRRIKRYAYTGSGEVSYDFNNYNAIHSSIRFNQGGFKTDGTTAYHTVTPTENVFYDATNNTKTVFGGFDWNADYTHKFKKEGEELTVSGQWSHSKTDVDYTNEYTAVIASQLAQNGGRNDEYTGQVDYSLPISKSVKMEAGGKTISRVISSNSDFYDKTDPQGDYIYNPATSNVYDYNQKVYAGYSVFSFTLPKNWSLQTGARVENTQINGRSVNTTLVSGLLPFDNSYTTFVPSFALSKQYGGTQTFKLSYSKRIQRPSLQFLNPFINQSNPQNISQGNPNLAPETAQTVEFNYSTFIRSSVINASVYYKHTNNIIESLVTPGVVNTTTYANIGVNNSIGASFFGSITPVKALTFRTSMNVYTYNPSATDQFSDFQTSNDVSLQYNIYGGGTLTLNKGFTAETFAIINSPTRTIQGKNPSFGFIGFGVRKEVLNKKASIGINTLSPFKNAINFDQEITSKHLVQTSHTAFPFRSVGLTFSYNFGKVTFKQDNPMAPGKKGLNDDLKSGDQNGGAGQQ